MTRRKMCRTKLAAKCVSLCLRYLHTRNSSIYVRASRNVINFVAIFIPRRVRVLMLHRRMMIGKARAIEALKSNQRACYVY